MRNDWLTIDVVEDKSEVILTNMKTNTEYEIAVLPTNVLGSGSFSETVHVKTFGKNHNMLYSHASIIEERYHIYLCTFTISFSRIFMLWVFINPLVIKIKIIMGLVTNYKMAQSIVLSHAQRSWCYHVAEGLFCGT